MLYCNLLLFYQWFKFNSLRYGTHNKSEMKIIKRIGNTFTLILKYIASITAVSAKYVHLEHLNSLILISLSKNHNRSEIILFE